MKTRSTLTFGELTKNLAYIKVVWNGKVIFDDDIDNCEECKSFYSKKLLDQITGINGLNYIQEKYKDKKVYSMYMSVVEFHHCELYIEGEK